MIESVDTVLHVANCQNQLANSCGRSRLDFQMLEQVINQNALEAQLMSDHRGETTQTIVANLELIEPVTTRQKIYLT